MAHTSSDRGKLILRVKRLRGQVEGVQRALEEDAECFTVLQTVAACRGALASLMTEIVEGHIRGHILDPDQAPTPAQRRASEQLIDVLHSFLR